MVRTDRPRLPKVCPAAWSVSLRRIAPAPTISRPASALSRAHDPGTVKGHHLCPFRSRIREQGLCRLRLHPPSKNSLSYDLGPTVLYFTHVFRYRLARKKEILAEVFDAGDD